MTQKAVLPHQNEHTLNMTSGSTVRLMTRFAVPVFLSQLFQQLYNTADSLIVGRFLGTEALAAVSSSGALIFLLISFFSGLTMGAGVVIARYFGAGDEDRVSRAIHTDLCVGLLSGVLLTLLGMLLTPTLLRLMNTDPSVMPLAREYFFYYFSGGVALVMYNTLKDIMNALGDSRRPLYYLIFSSLFNIAADVLFIGVFKWGVWSAAVATVLSQVLSCVLCLRQLSAGGQIYTVSFRKLRFSRDMLREILHLGLPSGVQNSMIALANVTVQSQINLFGAFATAGYGAYCKLEGFAFLPIMSFNMAITTFVSQNLGAKEYDRAKKGARFGIVCSMVLAELTGVILFALAPRLIALFDPTEAVVHYGVLQARNVTLFYFLLAFSHAVASVCRGAGKAFVPMLIMLMVWCVIRVIYILLVMRFFRDIALVYRAYPITWAVSSVIYLFYYKKSDWVHGFDQKKKKKETA